MDTTKNLAQLESEVKSLGLVLGKPSGRNDKYLKKDYVQILMIYNLFKRYKSMEQVPRNLMFRLSFDSPQLASNYFDLKEKERQDIWNNDRIWMVEKINGIRGTLIYSNTEKWCIYGRDISEKTYIPINYTHRMIDPKIEDFGINIVIDVEVQLNNRDIIKQLMGLGYEADSDFRAVAALMMMDKEVFDSLKENFETIFKFKLLDVYFYEEDLRQKSYVEREQLFDTCVEELKKVGFLISRPAYCKDNNLKKAFHEGILKEAGEGTIAVYIDKPCLLTGAREVKKEKYWVKVKKSLFASLFDPNALHDTVDGFVTQFSIHEQTGLVENAQVCAYDESGKSVTIAYVDAIPLSIRLENKISEGTVVELSGIRWGEQGLIEDPVVERIRFDKSIGGCIVNK